MTTVLLPITGWFSEPERKFEHEIPNPPSIGLEDQAPGVTKPRPFKSCLVEMLATVRDCGGDVRCEANLSPAREWLDGNGLICAIEAKKDDPFFINVLYSLTDSGRAFLAQHEAPTEW